MLVKQETIFEPKPEDVIASPNESLDANSQGMAGKNITEVNRWPNKDIYEFPQLSP